MALAHTAANEILFLLSSIKCTFIDGPCAEASKAQCPSLGHGEIICLHLFRQCPSEHWQRFFTNIFCVFLVTYFYFFFLISLKCRAFSHIICQCLCRATVGAAFSPRFRNIFTRVYYALATINVPRRTQFTFQTNELFYCPSVVKWHKNCHTKLLKKLERKKRTKKWKNNAGTELRRRIFFMKIGFNR